MEINEHIIVCNLREREQKEPSPTAPFRYLISKQIAVTAGADELKDQHIMVNLVNKQPVGLDMAFAHPDVIAGIDKRMIPVPFGERLLVDEISNDLLQLSRIAAALDGKLIITLELPGEFNFKHSAPP